MKSLHAKNKDKRFGARRQGRFVPLFSAFSFQSKRLEGLGTLLSGMSSYVADFKAAMAHGRCFTKYGDLCNKAKRARLGLIREVPLRYKIDLAGPRSVFSELSVAYRRKKAPFVIAGIRGGGRGGAGAERAEKRQGNQLFGRGRFRTSYRRPPKWRGRDCENSVDLGQDGR